MWKSAATVNLRLPFSSPPWLERNRSGTTLIVLTCRCSPRSTSFGLTFLGMNGHDFSATDAEVVAEILTWRMAAFRKTR